MKKLFLLMFCIVLLAGTVTAFEFDNDLRYEENDLKVVLENVWGLPLIGSDIGSATLKSHKTVDEIKKVGSGKQTVIWYDFNFVESYKEGLGDPEFKDMKTGELVERDYSFVYWGEKQKPIYEEICNAKVLNINGTATCEWVIKGNETYEDWLPYNSRDIPKEAKRIGLLVDVKHGDFIDVVLEIGGEKLEKHAIFSTALDVSLLASYPHNESSGSVLNDYIDLDDNGTTVNSPVWTGIALDYNGVNQSTNLTTLDGNMSGASSMSVAFQFVPQDVATGGRFILNDIYDASFRANFGYRLDSSTDLSFVSESNAGSGICGAFNIDIDGGLTFSDGVNYTIVGVQNTSGIYHWINGESTNFNACSGTGTYADGNTDVQIARQGRAATGLFIDARIGQVSFWKDRSLTDSEAKEVIGIINGTILPNAAPNITLNSPVEGFNSTSATLVFNGTVSDDVSIANVSLILDGEYNETNSSVTNASTLAFTKNIVDGSHNWTFEACDNLNKCTNATVRNFAIDTTNVFLNLTAPSGTILFGNATTNETLLWNVSDANIDTCFYDYNFTNVTTTCSTNTTTFTLTEQRNITFWANDTFGNTVSNITTWDYLLFFESQSFTSSTLEGGTSTFTANFLTNGTDITIANLSYNNTENIGSLSETSDNWTITSSITAPIVDADVNISFFWNITQGNFPSVSLDPQNQTVNNFGVDNCSVNTAVLYNFTIVDEADQGRLDAAAENTSGKVDLSLYDINRANIIANLSTSFSEVNPFGICFNDSLLGGETYVADVTVEYNADPYEPEFYNIRNSTITSDDFTTNITLFDLLTADSQEFVISYKDSSFLAVENALVQVQRNYLEEGQFKTVELPITDLSGETLAHLVVDDVIYTFIVTKDGELLGTFSNRLAKCQNPNLNTCSILLNSFASTIPVENFTDLEDFYFTLTYNDTTRIVESVFSIPSGSPATVTLNVTKEDALSTSVCTDQVVTSSGTLSCTVPATFGNATVMGRLFKDDNLQAQGQMRLDQSPFDLYGASLMFIGLFILLTLIGASITDNPVVTVISFMIGVVFLFALNLVANNGFIGATATILWLFMAILIVVVKAARRN